MFDLDIVRRSFAQLGYSDDLVLADWRTYDSINSEPTSTMPLVAFWDRPFDQFRSAIAVAERNGTPHDSVAKAVSSSTDCHVLLCDDVSADLWIRRAPRRLEFVDRVSASRISGLFEHYRTQVERRTVAAEKIRLRQYALYESDPHGASLEDWFHRPDVRDARTVFTALGKELRRICNPFTLDHARLLFRILALRIGLDRDWGIAADLRRESTLDFDDRANRYPTYVPPSSSISTSMRRVVSEKILESLRDYTFSYTQNKRFGMQGL